MTAGQRDVLEHGHALEQVEELEDDARCGGGACRARSSSLRPVTCSPASADLALVGGVEPGDQVQQGGLAAAGRPHQRDELAVAHGQVHAAQGADRRVLGLEGLAHAAHGQRGLALRHNPPILDVLLLAGPVSAGLAWAAPRACRPGDDLVGGDRGVAALHVLGADQDGVHGRSQRLERGLGEHGLALVRQLLQPLAEVHGVADQRVFQPFRRAEQGRRGLAGGQADAQPERRQAVRLPAVLIPAWSSCIATAAATARSA